MTGVMASTTVRIWCRCRQTQQTGILNHVLPVTVKAVTNIMCVMCLLRPYLHGSMRVFMLMQLFLSMQAKINPVTAPRGIEMHFTLHRHPLRRPRKTGIEKERLFSSVLYQVLLMNSSMHIVIYTLRVGRYELIRA